MVNPFKAAGQAMGAMVCSAPVTGNKVKDVASVATSVALAPLVGLACFIGAFSQTKKQQQDELSSIN